MRGHHPAGGRRLPVGAGHAGGDRRLGVDLRAGARRGRPDPPFAFIAYRFLAAALLLAAIRPGLAAWRGQPGLLAAGATVGLALFAGYGFQTVGLQYTTASNAGFITGLSVVLTPLLGPLVLRQPPGRWPVVGALVAAAGLACLSLQRAGGPPRRRAGVRLRVRLRRPHPAARPLRPPLPAYRLAIVQLATAGLLALAWAGVAGDLVVAASVEVWVAFITSAVASAAAFLIQTRAQREVSPTRTAVIFTMEPVFAGLFGFLLASRAPSSGEAGSVPA